VLNKYSSGLKKLDKRQLDEELRQLSKECFHWLMCLQEKISITSSGGYTWNNTCTSSGNTWNDTCTSSGGYTWNGTCTYTRDKPSSEIPQNQGIVGLRIMKWDTNMTFLPQFVLKLVQLPSGWANVKQNKFWIAINEPPAKMNLKQLERCIKVSYKYFCKD